MFSSMVNQNEDSVDGYSPASKQRVAFYFAVVLCTLVLPADARRA